MSRLELVQRRRVDQAARRRERVLCEHGTRIRRVARHLLVGRVGDEVVGERSFVAKLHDGRGLAWRIVWVGERATREDQQT